MKKKFKCVCVYTGNGENSINSVWKVEGNNKGEVIDSEFEKCVDEMGGMMGEFYEKGKWGYSCGEEDVVVVIEEGEEMFEKLDNYEEWEEKEEEEWGEFVDNVGV